MFLRPKALSIWPSFATPSIKLWANKIIGYTGTNAEGYFEHASGITGCTAYVNNGKKYLKNIGIFPDKVIHSANFLAEIPGDNLNFYGATPAVPNPPYRTFVFGSIVLPKKYEGITLQNTVVTETGEIKYVYAKGRTPPSISLFFETGACPTYQRDDNDRAVAGDTAGYNENNVAYFSVVYSDDANNLFKDKNLSVIYSVDPTINIPNGIWNPNPAIFPGCSPCRVRNPVTDLYRCWNRPDIECGGVPYAYFQTIPEPIEILSLNLAQCRTDAGERFISVTDTTKIAQFELLKAIETSNSECKNTIIPSGCIDQKTFAVEQCNPSEPTVPSGTINCKPNSNIGKGKKNTVQCNKYSEVDCNNNPACQDCSIMCPSRTLVVEFVFERYKRFFNVCDQFDYCGCFTDEEIYSLVATNTKDLDTFVPDSRCGTTTGTLEGGQRTYECVYSTVVVGPCDIEKQFTFNYTEFGKGTYGGEGCNPAGNFDYNSPKVATLGPFWGSCSPFVINGKISCGFQGPGSGCCCCCAVTDDSCGTATPNNPPDGNAVFLKYTHVPNYTINPYLMFTNNREYFDIDNIKGISYPNFSKYIADYTKTWIADRQDLYPAAQGYKPYFKNPQCSISVPRYFIFNESLPFTLSPNLAYDSSICAIKYEQLPNYDVPCQAMFGVTGGTIYSCAKNIKHNLLEERSFQIACANQYDTSACWKEIKTHYEIYEKEYYGICNGIGVTLTIQLPIGLTLTDCTNILSWDILSKAPKR